MSYEPTNWKSGDTITSAKLNKLENGLAEASGGGGGGVLVVHATGEFPSLTLDKTAGEIAEAYNAGTICFVITADGLGLVITDIITTFVYEAGAVEPNHVYTFNAGQFVWIADSATDYPIMGDK